MDKAILYQPWGGLGDNLQFSTLPEEYSKKGIEFYLHADNVYRNQEIYDLVWALNPFVKGVISGETASCGSCMELKRGEQGFIKDIEKSHGIETENKYPKIYYNPNNIEIFSGKTVLCLNSVSAKYDINKIKNKIQTLLSIDDDIVILTFDNVKADAYDLDVGGFKHQTYAVKTIFEHCDIIFSCKRYICLFSGQSVLASAIKHENKTKTNVIVIALGQNKEQLLRTRGYYFDNLNYEFI